MIIHSFIYLIYLLIYLLLFMFKFITSYSVGLKLASYLKNR